MKACSARRPSQGWGHHPENARGTLPEEEVLFLIADEAERSSRPVRAVQRRQAGRLCRAAPPDLLAGHQWAACKGIEPGLGGPSLPGPGLASSDLSFDSPLAVLPGSLDPFTTLVEVPTEAQTPV